MSNTESARILVLAGVNGAGKSSILGAAIRQRGEEYFNPDEYARQLLDENPGLTPETANAQAWTLGMTDLEQAIRDGTSFSFETTLGGNTISSLLEQAVRQGRQVSVRFMGLEAPERHIERVAARVRHGGHDIPTGLILKRYESSRRNLVNLLPGLADLVVYDNSQDLSPESRRPENLRILIRTEQGQLRYVEPDLPDWAAHIAEQARTSGDNL